LLLQASGQLSWYKLHLTLSTTSCNANSSHTFSNNAGLSKDDNDTAGPKWDENAKLAAAKIFLYLSNCVYYHIFIIQNPEQLLGQLQANYKRKVITARIYLFQQLFTLQLDIYRKHKANVLQLYLDDFHSHVQQLHSFGALVCNEIEP
jgi:hypothetical protein